MNVRDVATDPSQIWSVVHGHTQYWTTLAAVRLGVFDALADGPAGAPALATRCDADAGRLEVLCDALVGIGLLERAGDAYVLTPASDAFLVTGRSGTMAELVELSPGPHDNWPVLDATVRRGAPRTPLDDDTSGAFYAGLARATFPTQHAVARRAGPAVWGRYDAPRLLELGAGAAPWAAALLAASPAASATVNDLPAVIPEAVATLAEGVDRVELLAGDYLEVDIEEHRYDVVVLGHVLRAEPDERVGALVARAARAVCPGGTVVVADYFLDDDRRGPAHALLLAVTMMASTHHGRTLTAGRCRESLTEAGFAEIDLLEPVTNQQLMVARMPTNARREGDSR